MRFATLGRAAFVLAAVVPFIASAQVTPETGYSGSTYYANPNPSTESLISFDWTTDGDLFYTTGDPSFGTQMTVYHLDSGPGGTPAEIFSDASWPGSRIVAADSNVYFNDSGNFSRFTDFYYYKYDPAAGGAPANVGTVMNLWDLATRTGGELFGSAADASWQASIVHTALDASGDPVTSAMTNIGTIGEASGPLAFDADGNLYYAHGYAAPARIFRFTAAEVDAAIADPATNPLDPAGHEWADIPSGFDGATGMACDADGNVFVTCTSFGNPGELRRYTVDASGANTGNDLVATAPGRLETVRIVDGVIYVSDSSGIYAIEPAEVAVLTIEVTGPNTIVVTYDGAAVGATDPARYLVTGPGLLWLGENPDHVNDLGGNAYELVWLDGTLLSGSYVSVEVSGVESPTGGALDSTASGGTANTGEYGARVPLSAFPTLLALMAISILVLSFNSRRGAARP